ncbi:hypothetical protein MMC19_000306 [Ptychographa xylographoides]|nr:hypothetical protein [Ptychographa xylographoides]
MQVLTFLTLALVALAAAQTPFPIAQSSYPTPALQTFTSVVASYEASLQAQPAWTSFADELCTIEVDAAAATIFSEASCNPVILAEAFLEATATPFWYSELPSDLQGYVSSVANAEASILGKAVGSGADRIFGSVKVMGVMLAAAFLGMLLL